MKFHYQLCNIENSLLQIFNKLNDIQYVNGIVNLSRHILTKSETGVLSKGLEYCPTPGATDIGNIIQDLDVFKRKTRLNLFFQGSNEDPEDKNTQSGVPFEHKSLNSNLPSIPVGPFQLETMFYSIEQDLHRLKYRQPRKKNLNKEESQSIKSLRNHPDIIIKPADKGSAIVILDKHKYISEGERQLHDEQFYEETNTDLTGEVIHRVNLFVNNMLQRGQITQKTSSYLTTDIDRTQQFYLLPKIHKDMHNPPGRPIVSGSGGPTEKISQFVDHFIGPLVPLSRSYIRDFTHMINILQDYRPIPNMLLCTLDITSLYTNIPHHEGVEAIKELLAIHRDTNALPHNSYIIELLQVVLTNNYFDFNGKHYHQKSGTAMGTKLAPSYANLFMSKFEQDHVYTYYLQPILWKRFIDDIFLIWTHGMDSLEKFILHLNTVHPTLKFTSVISSTEIAFLDLTIYITDDKLCTRLYTKDTDRHMYLNFHSKHPLNLKRSIPYSQFLRLKRIHSESHYLIQSQIHLYWYFIWREYPHDVVLEAWQKTNKVNRESLLDGSTDKKETKAPLMFITTYNSANPKFREIISKHWSFLGRSSATRELSNQDIMVTPIESYPP